MALNSAKTGYNVQCPKCAVSVRFGLPTGSYSRRESHRCYRCRSTFSARYSVASATDESVMISTESGVEWPSKLKVAFDITWSQGAMTAASAGPAVEIDLAAVRAMLEPTIADIENRARQVIAQAQEAVETAIAAPPTVIEIHLKESEPAIEIQARERHAAYADALDAVVATGKCMLVGPPGSGKSTLARQIAEDLGYEFTFLACTEGLSEAHILGRMNAAGEYVPSAFVQGFEGSGPYANSRGVVHLWDEVDAMDANTALVINEALSNGHVAVPNRSSAPYAKMRKPFLQFAAANTWGTGAQVEHTGRNALDAAFLDRFAMTAVWVDYDLARERSIAEGGGIENFANALWKIRENTKQHQIRRAVSTRSFIHGAKLKKSRPEYWTTERLVERFFSGWPTPERAKAMEGVELDAIEAMHDDAIQEDVVTSNRCPKCNGKMIRRTARRGPRAGQPFFGCARYPLCNGTREA